MNRSFTVRALIGCVGQKGGRLHILGRISGLVTRAQNSCARTTSRTYTRDMYSSSHRRRAKFNKTFEGKQREEKGGGSDAVERHRGSDLRALVKKGEVIREREGCSRMAKISAKQSSTAGQSQSGGPIWGLSVSVLRDERLSRRLSSLKKTGRRRSRVSYKRGPGWNFCTAARTVGMNWGI